MRRTANISSSPDDERLISLPLARLHPHPANANLMAEDRLEKLTRNIEREGRYPPIVVRPDPDGTAHYQVLDGHQRLEVLRRLGHEKALCFPWPCDDATALVLLATLNRLQGEDVPSKRAELLSELASLVPAEELALLLPENEASIQETLSLLDLDEDALLAELTAAAAEAAGSAPRLISFVVLPEDEERIEAAIQQATASLTGSNRRGRALGVICRHFLEDDDA